MNKIDTYKLMGVYCGNCNSCNVIQEFKVEDHFVFSRVKCEDCLLYGAWVSGSDIVKQARNLKYIYQGS